MTLSTAQAKYISPDDDSYGFSEYVYDEKSVFESTVVTLKLVEVGVISESPVIGHMFDAKTVPAGTFMAKAYTTLVPEKSIHTRQIKGSNKKSGSGKINKSLSSSSETNGCVELVISVISQSLSDATPHSIIMDISGQSATAAPDIGAVFDAVHFFRSDRLLTWTSIIGAESDSIRHEFERQFSEWIDYKGFALANKVINGVLEAMRGNPSGLTPEGASTFINTPELVKFWCDISGVHPNVLSSCLKDNIGNTKIKRNDNSHKVVNYKLVSV